jgi:predicted nuclease of predicted toxin-antitoxin system
VIKIIVDMNLPPRWVPVLKAEGWDAANQGKQSNSPSSLQRK